MCRKDFNNLIKFCCGMGIGTYGFDMCGMEAVCAMDWSEPVLKAYAEMHPGTLTVLGDITQSSTIRAVYSKHPKASVLMSSFACLPAVLLRRFQAWSS